MPSSSFSSRLPLLFIVLVRILFLVTATDEMADHGLVCEERYGSPPVSSCLGALEEFSTIVAARGYALNDMVEWTYASQPRYSALYPSEEVTKERYVFFRPNPGDTHTCVLEFRLFRFVPHSPPSVLATHDDLLAAAKDILAYCVFASQKGGSRIVDYSFGRDTASTSLMAYLVNGRVNDPTLQRARQATIDYRPSRRGGGGGGGGGAGSSGSGSSGASSSSGTGRGSGRAGGESSSGGGAGGSSSNGGAGPTIDPNDKGKGIQSWYCKNVGGNPGTGGCWPGWTCQVAAAVNEFVLWGARKEWVEEVVGTCGVSAASVFGDG